MTSPCLDSESVSPSVTHHQVAGPTSKFCSCWGCPRIAGMLSCCSKVSISIYTVSPLHIIEFHSGHLFVKFNSFVSPTRSPTKTISYLAQYCNRFILLFTQMIHQKQTPKIKDTCLILQYSTLKSTVVQYNNWHGGAHSHPWKFTNSKFKCVCMLSHFSRVQWPQGQ